MKAINRQFFKKMLEKGFSYALNHLNKDIYNSHSIRGEVFWELRDGKSDELQEIGHIKNIVTLDASILIARLLKPTSSVAYQSEPKFGIYGLAVGTGDISWNVNNPPAGNERQRSLYNEIARKQAASASFIDADGGVSSIPTNVIDITTIFSESEAVGGLTEMGLIGGDLSTNMAVQNPVLPPNGVYDPTVDLVGLDTLCNYVTFPVINKPASSTLSWVWRISF